MVKHEERNIVETALERSHGSGTETEVVVIYPFVSVQGCSDVSGGRFFGGGHTQIE
jgi:hypothetical protein